MVVHAEEGDTRDFQDVHGGLDSCASLVKQKLKGDNLSLRSIHSIRAEGDILHPRRSFALRAAEVSKPLGQAYCH